MLQLGLVPDENQVLFMLALPVYVSFSAVRQIKWQTMPVSCSNLLRSSNRLLKFYHSW